MAKDAEKKAPKPSVPASVPEQSAPAPLSEAQHTPTEGASHVSEHRSEHVD